MHNIFMGSEKNGQWGLGSILLCFVKLVWVVPQLDTHFHSLTWEVLEGKVELVIGAW